MPKTIIHVNKHRIAANKKYGRDDPVISVKTYKNNRYAKYVKIGDNVAIVQRTNKPLSCGAVVWVETNLPVTLDNEQEKCIMKGCDS
jgi:hypothetical protein